MEFEVTSPDGKKFIVNAPDGATQEEALAFAQSQHAKNAGPPSMGAVALNAVPKAVAALPDSFINAPTNLYNLGKVAYGAAAYALGYKDVGDSVEMSEPPNLAHKALSAVGAISPDREPQTTGQRVVDAAVQGGVGFLANPVNSGVQLAKNVALGATSGTAGAITKEMSGSDTAAIAVSMLTPLAVRHSINGLGKGATNEVLGKTIKDGMDEGYVVPPSLIKPVLVRDKIESFGGKAAVLQQASLKNQEITNKVAAREIGLPENEALTPAKLEEVRGKVSGIYQEVADLPGVPKPAKSSVERGSKAYDRGFVTLDQAKDNSAVMAELRQARSDASLNFKHYERTQEPKSLKLAEAAWKRAGELEDELEQAAQRAGKPELVTQLREARQLIAKTHDVERALNEADGNVSAAVLGKALAHGKPLTGGLLTIARFHNAFSKAMRDGSKVPSPNVSALDPVASGALGMAGFATAGPAGALAGGVPLLRGPARRYLLGKGVQDRLMKNPPKLDETMLRSILAGRSISEGD